MAIKTLNLFIFPRQTFARVAAAAAREAREGTGGCGSIASKSGKRGSLARRGFFFCVRLAVRFGSMFALSVLLLLSVAYLGAHIENANTRTHTHIATPTCRHTHTLELNCFGSFCLAAASAPLFLSECRISFILLLFIPFHPLSLFLIPYAYPYPNFNPCSLFPVARFVCQSLMKCPMNCDPKIKAKLNARSHSLIDRKRCSTQLIQSEQKGNSAVPRIPTLQFAPA